MQKFGKIFFIAIISIVVVNSECMMDTAATTAQTMFDLPDNTPGLMETKQIKKVCGQDKECVHVIVPGSHADEMLNTDDGGFDAAIRSSGNIYFPSDGTQPTTPEAVEYSCANVDAYNEHSPITEWYMKMFGVSQLRNVDNPGVADGYIKAGWSTSEDCRAVNAQRIISLDASLNDTMVDDHNIPGAQISRRALFEREFRKIASTSTGRQLLYRIIMEIRRTINGVPDASKYTYEGAQEERNTCCSMTVRYGKENAFYFQSGIISFASNTIPNTVIGAQIQDNVMLDYSINPSTKFNMKDYIGCYAIVVEKLKPLDVSLFHELTHWFHFLKNQKRYHSEVSNKNLLESNMGKYYWNDFIDNKNDSEEYITGVQWRGSMTGKRPACPEEIRNILGMPLESSNFENGDDLSENTYRKELNLPLRFGHRNIGFIESEEAIKKVLSNIGNNYIINSNKIAGNLSEFSKGLGNSLCHN